MVHECPTAYVFFFFFKGELARVGICLMCFSHSQLASLPRAGGGGGGGGGVQQGGVGTGTVID